MKQAWFWIGAVIVAAACNVLIFQKEQTLANGRQLFLKLAPVDPRSLMQGDYMRLGYELADKFRGNDIGMDGRLVVQVDARGIGTEARLEDDKPPAVNEILLRYRNRGGLRLGAESYFFQEGSAHLYDKARYGELRVDAAGNSVLAGLRGENLEVLGKP
jgi:uncharacterized membrane-anchored protein